MTGVSNASLFLSCLLGPCEEVLESPKCGGKIFNTAYWDPKFNRCKGESLKICGGKMNNFKNGVECQKACIPGWTPKPPYKDP